MSLIDVSFHELFDQDPSDAHSVGGVYVYKHFLIDDSLLLHELSSLVSGHWIPCDCDVHPQSCSHGASLDLYRRLLLREKLQEGF